MINLSNFEQNKTDATRTEASFVSNDLGSCKSKDIYTPNVQDKTKTGHMDFHEDQEFP